MPAATKDISDKPETGSSAFVDEPSVAVPPRPTSLQLRFNRPFRNYSRGDIAQFPREFAAAILKTGSAVEVEPAVSAAPGQFVRK